MSSNIENRMNRKGTPVEELIMDEKPAKSASGMKHLLLNLFLLVASIVVSVFTIMFLDKGEYVVLSTIGLIVAGTYVCIISPIYFGGLKVLKPKEALVLTLFGQYFGTLKGPGFFFVNPFVTAAKPEAKDPRGSTSMMQMSGDAKASTQNVAVAMPTKKISLKAMTLSNDKQKINDAIGNPIIIGIVVIWQVVNTAKAVFNVDNYTEFLSIQSDSALRNVVRLYPYDVSGDGNEKTLRGSSLEVADKLKSEIQEKVLIAGIEIIEAKITHLSYAPEIAAAMLQRQQASAIIDARQMIVEGAVGMVEMALQKLNEHEVVHLDEERKAAMVSNLLVVLCGNKDAQPIVNSGSLY